MSEAKKWMLSIFIVVLSIIAMACFDGGFRQKLHNENASLDTTPVVLSDASDEMPESSPYTYGVSEYQIINDMTSQGMVLREYKKVFKNTSRRDYDISEAYHDFDEDMGQYTTHLRQALAALKAQRPAVNESKQEQTDTIAKVEKLYQAVSQYKSHEESPKDTVAFLEDCEYALSRLSLQAKLPH